MPDSALDLRNLRCVTAVATHGSFRRAAEALCLSQSTLTRRVQLLERRLQISVFSRSRSGSVLTAAGEEFVAAASVGAMHFQEAVERARRVSGAGQLRIGLVGPISVSTSSTLLKKFRQHHPGIIIRAEDLTSSLAEAGVGRGHLDAALTYASASLRGIDQIKLAEESLVLVVDERHNLSAMQVLDWDQLAGLKLLATRRGPGPDLHDVLLHEVPSSSTSILIQDVGFGDLFEMAGLGFGAILALESMAPEGCKSWRSIPIRNSAGRLSSQIIWSTANCNPALEKLIRVCRDVAR